VKRILAPVLLAALVLAVAGCGGSGHSAAVTVAGTTYLSQVKTGTPVACKGGSPRTEVPSGQAAQHTSEVVGGATVTLRLTRHGDGSVTVSCTRK
jgi:hypothetical protein